MHAGARMEVDDDDGLLLYCDEDPIFVDTTPPPATISSSVAEQLVPRSVPDDEVARLMMEYKARERRYAPASTVRTDYLHHLVDVHDDHRGLSSARSKAVHYIIYAFGRLGLAAATAFNAVNYLDRFFSINCHLSWEAWMVEVVSVACLSVACKMDEVNIPSLHDLQMEEVMKHSFRASTIRDMELTLLKALQWRLACITPYSFLDLLLLPTAATASRCTRLLLGSLPDPSFLRFDASVIAASALRCVLPLQDHAHLTHPLCQMDNDAHECFKMMKALDTSLDHHNHKYSDHQWSLISVIPFESENTVHNRSAVSRRLFGRPAAPDGALDEDKPHICGDPAYKENNRN